MSTRRQAFAKSRTQREAQDAYDRTSEAKNRQRNRSAVEENGQLKVSLLTTVHSMKKTNEAETCIFTETPSLLLLPSSFQPLEPNTATPPAATNHRKKRALAASTSDEDDSRPSSSRRTRKRNVKRKKHDEKEIKQADNEDDAMDRTATTLPGGYVDTDIDIEEDSRPTQGQRRKRDETSDLENEDEDRDEDGAASHTSERERHRLRGRAVRRRRADDTTENDEEMTLVQPSSRRSRRTNANAGKSEGSSEEATTEERDETSVTESSSDGERMEVDSLDGRRRPPISLGLRATPFNETSTDEDEEVAEDDDEHTASPGLSNHKRNSRAGTRQSRKTATQTPASIRKGKTLAVAAAKKKHAKQTPQSRRVSSRRKGEIWTEANGQKFKISTKDGIRRQLVSVKEWRHKYKMVRLLS